jgi:cell wall-associated NlpC family hydrolase
MVYKLTGYSLPRNLNQQATAGKKIKTFEESKPGDLVFFSEKGGVVSHVGIVLDEGKIIHSFGQVRIDNINEEGILNPDTKIYTHLLHSIRRIIT